MTILLYASKLLSVATGGAAPAWFSRRLMRRFTTSRSSASRPSRFFRGSTRSYTGPLVVCAACQGTSQGLRVGPTPAPLATPARVHSIAFHALGHRVQEGDAAVGVGGDDRIAKAGWRDMQPLSPLVRLTHRIAAAQTWRAQASFTTPGRFPARPTRPAVAEALPGLKIVVWYGFAAPAKLPTSIFARLPAVIIRILDQPRRTRAHPSRKFWDLGELVRAVRPLHARRSRQVGQASW